MTTPLIILTGSSGAGKTTIANRLLKKKSLDLQRFITCTTRPKRKGEKQGREYHFMTDDEFKSEKKKGNFFEWAKVYDYYYGSHMDDCNRVCKNGQPVLMNLDVQGMRAFKKKMPHAFIVFIDVPKLTVLERLGARMLTPSDFKIRTKQYNKEAKAKKEADVVVPNPTGQLDDTVEKIACIIDFYLQKFKILHPKKTARKTVKKTAKRKKK